MWESPRFLKFLSRLHRVRYLYSRRTGSKVQLASEQRDAFYERVWRDTARLLGAEVEALGEGILQIRSGAACTRVCRNETPLDDPITLSIAGNKPLVYRLLTKRGLPVVPHCAFRLHQISRAYDFLEKSGRPCVVKPASGAAGRGVTTGITSAAKLRSAAAAASVFGSQLLIEEQVEGDVYRLLYLDGQLLDAIVRKSPTVTGDGRSTVRQLIERANEERLGPDNKAQVLIAFDTDMKFTLDQQSLSLASVPAAGRTVIVKRVVNENAGAENVSARDLLCASVIKDGADAAAAVGARLAGVDIMTVDPTKPLRDTGGVILEVNTTPGYYSHYHQAGEPKQVALPVLRTLLTTSNLSGKVNSFALNSRL